MRLDLLLPFKVPAYLANLDVQGMSLDSREIKKNGLFVALQGAQLDGRSFIEKAIHQGACVVLSETMHSAEHGDIKMHAQVAEILVFKLPYLISQIAYQFYFPKKNLHKVIGITGTNGKTTIASLLANALQLLDVKNAQMGTIGNGLFGQLKSSLNTTLDAISIFAELASYQQQGAQYTLMEVSSHGLDLGRVQALPFYSAIFTNLTRDHLDHHGTMACYGLAKKRLFSEYSLQQRIINIDDPTGEMWLSEFSDAISYGKATNQKQYFTVKEIFYQKQGICFNFQSSWGDGQISAPFYGHFNVQNLSAVLCQLLAEGFSITQLKKVFLKLNTVPGRMEQYYFSKQDITFVVDYAHTPDALEKALQALHQHSQKGELICLFGCGGDRDTGKRPEMAKVAEKLASQVILVDDNPRTEQASVIMQDILAGFTKKEGVQCIHSREEAIRYALKHASAGDIILVAGKGHEDYQIIGKERIHYSDRELLTALRKEEQA
ncbi:UDP-N-acetylmuramyl-tripeptide synthetase [Psychromonas sp. CNPT3]|uniref:UDP-N-acetylmuramoyl-L-alanyl-D-glutamate--2, 6-diaminopimelate ligase n=1 Tax=Psychromonas sp. CNPT3 TaxID=314282 RepID=UPI00006E769E|nr:UDP-N-acetylmuramoyl-L-alanyl-D-glutamate--2,6-diaminopimelate ligase [Psychromonas sp. CNPT3]AGH80636.1 UDP-N-acetylmuramyl-tripeptide synthetase [Psychromonas sp. CNPT3]